MILTIKCGNCHQDIVNYVDEFAEKKQLVCMPCGSKTFEAYHVMETQDTIGRLKEGLMKLKAPDLTDFDSQVFDNIQ